MDERRKRGVCSWWLSYRAELGRNGKRLYSERNLIGRFFSKLKHLRRVATRYAKLAANFRAMVQIASWRVWLPAYGSSA